MVFLKEDGSLDVDRINQLPIEDYMKVVGSFTYEERKEYYRICPFYESTEPVKPIGVDYSLEEDIEKNGSVVIMDKIKELREKMTNSCSR